MTESEIKTQTVINLLTSQRNQLLDQITALAAEIAVRDQKIKDLENPEQILLSTT